MPAVIESLHKVTRASGATGSVSSRTLVYPETIISAVHMLDGKRTLDEAITEFDDESSTTVFNQDGSITKTMTRSGMVITTVFGESIITDTCRYSDSTLYYTQTTTFNNNGSITVSRTYADNT